MGYLYFLLFFCEHKTALKVYFFKIWNKVFKKHNLYDDLKSSESSHKGKETMFPAAEQEC